MSRWEPITSPEMIVDGSIPEPNSGCWLWLGSVNNWGYGRLWRPVLGTRAAHRLAYIAFVGVIPTDHLVCHRCDTPCCVNPDHLFVGSAVDNMRDMAKRVAVT